MSLGPAQTPTCDYDGEPLRWSTLTGCFVCGSCRRVYVVAKIAELGLYAASSDRAADTGQGAG